MVADATARRQRRKSWRSWLQGRLEALAMTLRRVGTLTHKGFMPAPDPFAPRRRPGASFFNALLATALFRCWHILLFFAAWATAITVLDHNHFKVRIPLTLLTVVGTVLGFIISYRTTSSFERYNEGRRLWSQIILASRTFARSVWFHVPDLPGSAKYDAETLRSRGLVEKKTIVNLIEAFGVAVKHYLRGEDGIYYQDLYFLVKFLPAYALPPGIPSNADLTAGNGVQNGTGNLSPTSARFSDASARPSLVNPGSFLYQRTGATPASMSAPHLPLPATTPGPNPPSRERKPSIKITERPVPPPLVVSPPTALNSPVDEKSGADAALRSSKSVRSIRSAGPGESQKVVLARADEAFLMPGSMPPKYHLFDLFPFSLLVRCLTKRGREIKGKKAARIRAKMLRAKETGSHNLPLEISLYLSSYIATLQQRKQTDVPTTNNLIASLNQLVDALTGLERILTTPIPFSYSIHLWVVTALYCLSLPSQIVATMGWQTIPATVVLAFVFFGFLVAGEEIENPFGYDKNDLNLDHFTSNIIRNELRAITSTAAPDPDRWIFAPENDMLFVSDVEHDERVGPDEWVRRGSGQMLGALSMV
ncbi:UPF0187-domain-containing protein [Mycena pura]|uniref:UPF0187-domain-containing protein n=1 Tax=Mycena pura TaxID=153505 RepID=A0AAD6V4I7_9AGAR|nr:UPF0187-domain-containing protein [Mycena pura]